MEANEAYPDGVEITMSSAVKTFSLDTWNYNREGYKPTISKELQPYQIWSYIINIYSEGAVTKASDKLVAIGSLAIQMQRTRQGRDSYVAGLWRKHLQSQLAWRNMFSLIPRYRAQPYRASTWS